MQQDLPRLRDEPIAFAHRGARAVAPENTIEAFTVALKLGANGLETDVWLTADGVPVLDHDGVVRRGIRKVPIASVTRAELPAHIPTVSDLIDSCGTQFDLSVDVKDPAVATPFVRVMRDKGCDLSRVWLCHWEITTVLALRHEFPDVRVVDSTRLGRMKEGPERRMARLAAAGVDAVNLHHADWNGGLGVMAHRFGLYAFAWDAQQPRVINTLIAMGMDAIYSDYVDRMVDAYMAVFGHAPRG